MMTTSPERSSKGMGSTSRVAPPMRKIAVFPSLGEERYRMSIEYMVKEERWDVHTKLRRVGLLRIILICQRAPLEYLFLGRS